MDRKEVIKWLKIMKANLNSFPEVSNAKKIEALAEAIRLLKNEQSKEPSSSEKPNKSEKPTSSYNKSETLVRLDVYKQVAKERDIAIEQLHELGYEFGQKIEPTTKNDLGVEKVEVYKPCINYEDGCEEWAGCPCVHFKARK